MNIDGVPEGFELVEEITADESISQENADIPEGFKLYNEEDVIEDSDIITPEREKELNEERDSLLNAYKEKAKSKTENAVELESRKDPLENQQISDVTTVMPSMIKEQEAIQIDPKMAASIMANNQRIKETYPAISDYQNKIIEGSQEYSPEEAEKVYNNQFNNIIKNPNISQQDKLRYIKDAPAIDPEIEYVTKTDYTGVSIDEEGEYVQAPKYSQSTKLKKSAANRLESKMKEINPADLTGGLSQDLTDEQKKATDVDDKYISTVSDLDKNFQETTQDFINNDSFIVSKVDAYARAIAPQLEAKKKDLESRYTLDTPESLERANKEFTAYRDSLINGLTNNDASIQDRVNNISTSVNDVYQSKLKELGRKQSDFYSAIDFADAMGDKMPWGVRHLFKGVNLIAESGGSSTSDLITRTGENLDQWFTSRYETKQILENLNTLEELKEKVDAKRGKDSELSGKINKLISFKQKQYNESLKGIKESQIKKAESQAWRDLARKADWEGTPTIQDVLLGFGESLPYMVGGTAEGVAAIAGAPLSVTLGLAVVGGLANSATFFGDSFASNIEEGLKEEYESKSQEFKNKTSLAQYIDENFAETVAKGKYNNDALNASSAIAMSLLERTGSIKGVKAMYGALGKGTKEGLASIWKAEIPKIISRLKDSGVQITKASLSEGFTEAGQEIIDQANTALNVKGFNGLKGSVDVDRVLTSAKAGATIGAFLPFAGRLATQSRTEIRNIARDFVTKFDIKSAKGLYESGQIFKKLEDNINDKFKNANGTFKYNPETGKQYTEEEYKEEINTLSDIRNEGSRIPRKFSVEGKEKALDVMLQNKKLERQKANLDPEFTKDIDNQIKQNKVKLARINAIEDAFAKAEEFGMKGARIAEGLNTDFVELDNDAAVEEYIKKRNLKGGKQAAQNRGSFFTDPNTGEDIIILNKDRIKKSGKYFTGAHEVLHAVLKKTIAQGDEKALAMARAIKDKLKTIDTSSPRKRQQLASFYKRLNQYLKDPDITSPEAAEEAMTLMSEALEYGEVRFDRTFAEQISDFVKRIAAIVAPSTYGTYKFENAEDVYRFLRDYNTSFKKGKLSRSIRKAAAEGIEIGEELETRAIKAEEKRQKKIKAKRKAAARPFKSAKDTTLKELQEQGADPLIIAEEFRSEVERFVETKYRDTPDFDLMKDILVDEILSGKRGVRDLIVEYNNKSDAYKQNVTLGQFINNKQTGYRIRALEIAEKVLGEQFTQDVEEQRGLVAEESTEQVIEKEVESLRKKLDIKEGDELYNKIISTVKRTFGTKLPTVSSGKFISELQNQFRKFISADVKKLMGKPSSKTYIDFLEKYGESIYSKIPQKTINKRFNVFAKPVMVTVDGVRKQKRMTVEESRQAGARVKDEKAGNLVFEKAPYNQERFVEYHLNPPKGRPASKQTTLAEVIGEELGFDAAQQVLSDPSIIEKRQLLSGIDSIKSEVDEVVKEMGRGVDFKFAKDDGSITEISKYKEQILGYQAEQLIDVAFKYGYKDVNSNLTKEYRDKLALLDPIVGDFMNTIFEENIDLVNTVNGFQDILKQSDKVSELLKSKIKARSLLLYRKKVLDKDVADEFAKNTMAIARILDSSLLKSLDPKLNILGFKYGILDPARTKTDGTQGAYFNEYTEAKNLTVEDKEKLEKLGIDPNDIIAMNKDSAKLKPILKDILSTESLEAKKEKLKSYKTKIQNANVSNLSAFKYIALKLQDALKNGKITEDYLYQLLQAQTNIVLGFRALSAFDYIYLKEGNQQLPSNKLNKLKPKDINTDEFKKYKSKLMGIVDFKYRYNVAKNKLKSEDLTSEELEIAALKTAYKDLTIKGEHLGPNANTMADLFINIVNNTLTEETLNDILKEHTQFFGPTFIMDLIDSKGVEGGPKTALTSKEGLFRLTKFLPTKYANNVFSIDGQLAAKRILKEEVLDKELKSLKAAKDEAKNVNVKNLKESKVLQVNENMTIDEVLGKAATIDEALKLANSLKQPVKKIRVFDFDDTLAQTKSIVFYTKPDGTEGQLTAEEFAEKGARLVTEGAVMDFSDFNIVREGKRGPLFDVAKKIRDARGNEDLFVLTARAPESADAIYEFLKSEGLEFKRENIVGLGNSTGAAKANWIIDKAAEDYNDFYFADDAYANVEAVQDALSQIDVKSKVQQAKIKAAKDLNEDFNKIIEQTKGIASEKRYSKAKAKVRGAGKGNKKFFIPYSAEDFMGLIYPLLSKGTLGDSQMAWFKKNILNPYARAIENLSSDRIQMMQDFKELKKKLNVPKDLRKKNESGFTNEQAVRVYLFNKVGHEIPGLSQTDLKELIDIVNSDGRLKAFADQILSLTKGDGYVKPAQEWLAGTITTDLIDLLNTTKRKKYLEQSGYLDAVEQIFSKENLNKLEAAYGANYREAMENILARMKSGKNRMFSGSRLSNRVLDYINGSIGTIMFFNTRSAILQTISSINFLNWSFNNPYKAGKAFANQKQYWKDFNMLMNSDYLTDRRNGLKLNISENEIANAAATAKNKARGVINYILQKGYLPTQIADSFAIASGGATFYRNRVNDLVSKGMDVKEAEQQALSEWKETAEISQQSSDPSKISQQQASDLGRIILAFANTPMQYARIQKRAIQDLVNKRGDAKANVSKIIYYGVVQNLIFNALQQAVFAIGFGDDDEDTAEKKYLNTANGMLDSTLRGLGIAGATTSVVKNFLMDIYERSGRKRPEYVDSIYKLIALSPPISSKISKIRQAAYQFDSNKRREEVFDKGFSIDNPAYEAGAKIISATTNVPLDRVINKINNIEGALAEDTETWQTVAMLAGWPEWQISPKKTKTKSSRSKRSKRRKRKNRKLKR